MSSSLPKAEEGKTVMEKCSEMSNKDDRDSSRLSSVHNNSKEKGNSSYNFRRCSTLRFSQEIQTIPVDSLGDLR